jgi:1-acyl-sn-glycerol-3-phosphate acyltransferase
MTAVCYRPLDLVYGSAELVLAPVLARGFEWHVEGTHRIPSSGPVLLASNHVSYLDPLVLGYVARGASRKVRYLAKAELFRVPALGSILRAAHQIPVHRGTDDASRALGAAEAALAAGECVAVFPEGTISSDLDPLPAKTGTARLAAAAGVTVLPVAIWGTHRLQTKGRRPTPHWGLPCVVVVGEAVVVDGHDVAAATFAVDAAIAGVVDRARELYPVEPRAGDEAWWHRAPGLLARRAFPRPPARPVDDDGEAGAAEERA